MSLYKDSLLPNCADLATEYAYYTAPAVIYWYISTNIRGVQYSYITYLDTYCTYMIVVKREAYSLALLKLLKKRFRGGRISLLA